MRRLAALLKPRYLMYAAGLVLIWIGLSGIFGDPRNTGPYGWMRWFAGAVIVHDGFVVPVVLVIAVLLTRVPLPYRRTLQAALYIGATVTLVALPPVLGYGRTPDNPSRLPLAYGTNLTIFLTLLALVCGVTVFVQWLRRHPLHRKIS